MKDLTGDDYRVVRQTVLDIRVRFEMYDDKDNYIGSIDGNVVNGSCSIDAESDIRRSFSITIYPDLRSKLLIDEQGYIWINKFVHIYIGIIDMQTGEPREWKFGEFLFTNVNTTYDPTTNQMSVNCADMMCLLDGSKNGELGQLNIIYPAYEENEQGIPTHYNTIRNAVIDTVSQLGRIKDWQIDEIGEYNAMPLYNEDWRQYRIESMVELPDGTMQAMWDTIPFDQEFSAGTTVLTILNTFRDLYPNYESYFNEDGVYCMNMVPSGDEDPVIIDNSFFQSVYISENTSVDLTTVRNISHVWGQVLDTDFFSDTSTYEDGTYKIELEGYIDDQNTNYKNGDKIAFRVVSIDNGEAYYPQTMVYNQGMYGCVIDGFPTVLDSTYKVIFTVPEMNEADETYIQINGDIILPIYINGYESFMDAHTWQKGQQVALEIYPVDGVYYAFYNEQLENQDTLRLQVNNLEPIPIFDENTEKFLSKDKLEVDNVYVFKIKSKNVGNSNEFRAYWLGSWQAQGICALVDGERGGDLLYVNTALKVNEDVTTGYFRLEDGEFYAERSVDPDTGEFIYSGKYLKAMGVVYYQEDIDTYYRVVRRYSKEYFQEVYACPSVRLKVIPESPFTCQKIGEYMDVMTDDKNITSSSLAVARADWEVYKQARLTDSITLTTTLCPFADVNIKIEYKRHDLQVINPYIVKNISHDLSGGTTTWQLMRFYPLYERTHMTHGQIKNREFTYDLLAQYTYERI